MNKLLMAIIIIVLLAAGAYLILGKSNQAAPATLCLNYTDCSAKAALENNPEYCEYLDTLALGNKKDGCYVRLAIRQENKTYCEKVQAVNASDGCYYGISICSKQNQCMMISENDPFEKLSCYLSLIYLGRNSNETCAQIPYSMPNMTQGVEIMNSCYYTAAGVMKDYSQCRNILNNPTVEDDCVLQLVRLKQETDPTKCDLIGNSTTKNTCIGEINGSGWKQSNMIVISATDIQSDCKSI